MKKAVAVLLFFFTSFTSFAKVVVFRCDDIRLNIDSTNIEMFKLFDKYDINFTCAIIPFNKSGEPVEYKETDLDYLKSLKKRGIVEIALHGYSHTWTGNKGELDGLSYSEQFTKIKAGKTYLDSLFETDIVSFVPPRNHYDTSTIQALEDLGFSIISADSNSGSPIVPCKLNYIPFTCGELRLITEEMRKSQWGGVMVLMFHPFEIDDEYTIDDLESDLKYIKANNIRTLTLNEASKYFSINRIELNKEHNLLTNIFPSIKEWSYSYSTLYIYLIWTLNILLYLAPIAVSVIICGKKRHWILIANSILAITTIFIALRHISPLKLWFASAFISFLFAVINRHCIRVKNEN